MAVHIRLARTGTKKVPFYRIVAADQRAPRGGRFIERLGTWDPRRKELNLNRARVDYWLGQGAAASPTVDKLIKRAAAAPVQAPAEAPAATPAAAPAKAPTAAPAKTPPAAPAKAAKAKG